MGPLLFGNPHMCMRVYLYIHTYVRTYVYIHIHTCTLNTYTHIYAHIQVRKQIFVSTTSRTAKPRSINSATVGCPWWP